jgi:hypothetical protein
MSIKNQISSLCNGLHILEERLMYIRPARDSAGISAYGHHSLFTAALKFTILLVLQKADLHGGE